MVGVVADDVDVEPVVVEVAVAVDVDVDVLVVGQNEDTWGTKAALFAALVPAAAGEGWSRDKSPGPSPGPRGIPPVGGIPGAPPHREASLPR